MQMPMPRASSLRAAVLVASRRLQAGSKFRLSPLRCCRCSIASVSTGRPVCRDHRAVRAGVCAPPTCGSDRGSPAGTERPTAHPARRGCRPCQPPCWAPPKSQRRWPGCRAAWPGPSWPAPAWRMGGRRAVRPPRSQGHAGNRPAGAARAGRGGCCEGMRTKGLPSWPMALLCSGRLEMSPSATRARVAAAGPSLGGMASEVGSVGGCFDFQPGAAGLPHISETRSRRPMRRRF
jgi:hypothetical protein